MDLLVVADEVHAAIAGGRAVVALESSLIAQGLPAPHNLETALAAEAAVRAEGAVPATTAVYDGRLLLGAPQAVLERLADPASSAAKAASRDLGPLLAAGLLASTTVSATMRIAAMSSVRLMATGGIGGVHRGAATSFDVSSDIDELAATPVAVVCSGAKSILDLPATLELLETRRVPVIGMATDELPGFYATSAGLPVPHRVEIPQEAARALARHFAIPGSGGLLIVQPPPPELAIPADEMAEWIEGATAAAVTEGVRGAAVTPFVLSRVAELSGGRALRANIGLIVNNARIAARIAVAHAALRYPDRRARA
ncbi:MAG: pseudouridine-5'-phosphate glycosidase [Chloroflexota bacterium]|nr:pseudouridine-5'-phosphate glycosidase [Chloroflexota bacterium]